MRAITVSEFGSPEVLKPSEVLVPVPGPEDVLVRVLAAGVGPWDVSMRRGGWTGPMPYIPGGEFAGVVEGRDGEDAGLDEGAPVYGYPGLSGCYAQYVRCPVEQLAPIPAGLPWTDAAGAPIDALTAHQGLTDVLSVGRGDQVLITAGAGGLGHLAVQIARNLGARIVATASPQHHEFVHHGGAEVVIDHTKPDWPDQVREVMDGGAQQILACAGPTLAGAARAARDGATIATPVHGELPDTPGITWRTYNGEPSGSRLIRMAPWFDDGLLSVEVEARYFYENAAEAHRRVEEGHTRGKVVLIVDNDLAREWEV
jgi:NADPH:quinone reductase-like Zn-dependent oxidoreductase